jgi:Transposase DNA-binding/Transposase DDE domain
MNTQDFLDPHRWAEETFGGVLLKDLRRTRRAVKAAERMAANASASLPAQMQRRKGTKALYRLLNEPDVTFAELMQPHWDQTRRQMETLPVVLLVQDSTDLDYTHHPRTSGLGPIGDDRGRGLLLQTDLSIDPATHQVLGCAYQEPFLRQSAPKGETRAQRRKRDKEPDVWGRCVQVIGPARSSTLFVHVADRGADIFEFLDSCRQTQTHFVVRATQDRRVELQEETLSHLFAALSVLPAVDERPFDVPASHKRKARSTVLHLAWTHLSLLPPRHDPRLNKLAPMPVWVVRVWEEETPEGEEPLEWILLTSVPVTSWEPAWQRTDWYCCRWTVEDYHQCLKTGCRIEERQVQSADRLMRLLGLLSPVAVRLLQLRDLARTTPDLPAAPAIEPEALAIVAARAAQSVLTLTRSGFWTEVACMGGYQARKSDGPPGWKTLWKGWLYLQTLVEGVHLAFHLRL